MQSIASLHRFAAALPAAAVRTSVTVPLAFADGFETTAQVFTFRGLADGKEHLALALGDWPTAATPLARRRSRLDRRRADAGRLGHTHVELLSNNPDKASQLEAYGITIAERRPTGVFDRPANHRYLETKVHATGHTIDLPTLLRAA